MFAIRCLSVSLFTFFFFVATLPAKVQQPARLQENLVTQASGQKLDLLWEQAEQKAEEGNFSEAADDLIRYLSLRNNEMGLDSLAVTDELHKRTHAVVDLRPRQQVAGMSSKENQNQNLARNYLPILMFLGAGLALGLAWRYLKKWQNPG